MEPILIIADDLSGAADCAAGFALSGFGAVVATDTIVAMNTEAEVIAATTNTRDVEPTDAVAKVASVATQLMTRRVQILYKKIDSTLRGNIALELSAIRQAFSQSTTTDTHTSSAGTVVTIVAPAFPDTLRTTSGGRQYIGGLPIERTEMGHRTEQTGGSILRLLEPTIPSAVVVTLDTVRLGAYALQQAVEKCIDSGSDTLVCDAEQSADLRTIAEAGRLLEQPVLWAGSGGLARELAKSITRTGVYKPVQFDVAPVFGPTVSIIGSYSAVARNQVESLVAHGGVRELQVPLTVLRGRDRTGYWNEARELLGIYLRESRDVVVSILDDGARGESGDRNLCGALAQLIAPLDTQIGALVLSGGDTAQAVLDTLGIRELSILGEVEPGVVMAQSEDRCPRKPVILKAGAFGNERTLIRCHEFLRASTKCTRKPY